MHDLEVVVRKQELDGDSPLVTVFKGIHWVRWLPSLRRAGAPRERKHKQLEPPPQADADSMEPLAPQALADNSEPPTLLSLTTELLLLVIETLPAVSICRFGLVSHAAQEVAHADEVWSILLDQVWPDAAAATHLQRRSATEGPALKGCMQRFAALSYGPYPEVRAVGAELTWKDSAHNEIRFGQASQLAASATSCPWGLCHGSLLSDSSPPRRCICCPVLYPKGRGSRGAGAARDSP